MKKKTHHPIWIPVLVTVLATALVFVFAEYVFHIPSRFLEQKKEIPLDDGSWTPRPPIATPPPPTPIVEESGSTTTPPEPTACTMEYAPVCGADGRDYSNACMARAGGTTVVSVGNCKNEIVPVEPSGAVTPTEPIVGEDRDLSLFTTGSYQIYENKSFGYTLALPRFAYYQGIGGGGGASHALAVGTTSTGSEDLASSDVAIYFYKTPPATPPLGAQAIEIKNGTIYVVSRTTGTRVDSILEAVKASVQSIE